MKGPYIYFFFLVCCLTNQLFIYLFIFVTVTVKAIKQVFLSFHAAGQDFH